MSPLRNESLPTPLRIILVEDSEHDLIAFRRTILNNRPGTIIDHAYRAEELIDSLATLPDHYDLLVTDYKLPGITGLELCRQIMDAKVTIPCVILSGAGTASVVLEAFQAGVTDYLIKDSYQDYLRILPQFLKQVVRNFRNRHHAELFLQQRKLVAAISEIFLTSQEDLSPLYELTARRRAEELIFPSSLILLKEDNTFVIKAVYGVSAPNLLNSHFPVENTICWQTFVATCPINTPFVACPNCALRPFGIANCLAVPIRLEEDTMYGVVIVGDYKTRQGTEVHLPTLQIIANHLGRVIRQTEDQIKLRHYARRTAFLLKINQLILTAQSPDAIGQTVLDELQKILPEHSGIVLIFDLEQKQGTILAQAGPTLSPFARDPSLPFQCREFIEHQEQGETFCNTTLIPDHVCPLCTAMQEQGLQSFMTVPLLVDHKLIGTLSLCSRLTNIFSREYQILAEELAPPLAICLQKAHLMEEALRRRRKVHILSRRLSEVQENERKDLARDLHDSLGQNLAGLGINLQIISNQMQQVAPPPLLDRLQDTMNLTAVMTDQVRGIMEDLHPAVLDDYGLEAAIRRYGTELGRRFAVPITIKATSFPRLEPFLESGLFRIIQEGLLNAVRHARAQQITVRLEQYDTYSSIMISDNGTGFDPADLDSTQGLGLVSMRERAAQLGCSYNLSSLVGKGTTIQVEIQP